jgi:UDP-N-acetylmuramyl pentapeptide synthase
MNASGILLVNDSYNANPASVRAAIETVSGMRKGVKAVAVLGDMLELGDISIKAHQEIGSLVARNDFNYLLAVGAFAELMAAAAREAGMAASAALAFPDKDALVEKLDELIREESVHTGDLVLIKGSRGMRMEKIVAHLLEA